MSGILARPAEDARGALALVEPATEAWDAFVAEHPQGSLLQQWGWGELKAGAGWRARRLAVVGADGHIRAGALLLLRSRFGLSVAYTPRGPLLAGDPAADGLLLAGIERVARRARAVFLRLEPNLTEGDPAADAAHTWLLLQGLRPAETIQPRSSLHVALARPEEAIFAGFSKGHRADIRRAERGGVQVRVGDEANLGTFQAIMRATGARAGFGVHEGGYYAAAWRRFQPRSRLLLAELGGRAVAAHLVFADAARGLYLYSGADEEGLRSGANHLLEWHAMRWARGLGCAAYDLWGIPDALGRAAAAPDAEARAALEAEAKADPLLGVYRFKKGFGGRIVRYLPAYDRPLIPPLYGLALSRLSA
ncbi:MAG TPA: peptidoglycan bridge formation glycyltransferase FemA/FemB family protein [Chloroflexaceae bacterium]|nr:peptidoglycan bridge formation glycyltransferase FemA/FemB family protein [Chloroflexaceae bacterium]